MEGGGIQPVFEIDYFVIIFIIICYYVHEIPTALTR